MDLTEREELLKFDMERKMPRHYNRNMTIDDLNVQPNESALMRINMFGYDPINETKLLIKMGADPNITEQENGTALHYAVTNKNLETLKYLLSVGANPFIRDKFYGDTPYDLAMRDGHFKIAEILKNHMDPYDEPSDPDIDLLRDEAARYIQTIMRARIETDKKRKLTKRRYGKWSSPKTKREKDRRYMDLIRQTDNDDPMKGYERYSIYPERLLPPKKGGKRNKKRNRKRNTKLNRKYYTLRMY